MPRRDVVARARHRHGRGRPRDPGRVAEVGRARAAAHRSRRPRARRRLARAASSRSSAPTCSSRAVVARRMLDGEIEETVIPRNPLDVLAQQIVAISADEEIAVDDLHRLVRARVPVRGALARAARERARHARGPLPVRRVRRAAAAHRLGPHRRSDPRAHRRAQARGHERGHDPRPRPVRRLPRGRRRPRRRARRGDGLRGARRPDVPARRLDVADRGDHPRPRARLAGTGRAGRGAVLEGRGCRPSVRARRGDRQVLARARCAPRGEGAREASRRAHARRQGRAQPADVPERASGARRVSSRPTARS